MTPLSISSSVTYISTFTKNAITGVYAVVGYGTSYVSLGVRPAISLVEGLEYSSGTGSIDDPYIVDAPPLGGS